MALVSLFFTTNAKIGQMELDASISEGHEAQADLTQSPVEDGSVISDNIVLKPLRLTLEGVVSKTPISLIGSIATAAVGQVRGQNGAANAAALTGVASVAGLVAAQFSGSINGPASREPSDVYTYLIQLWKSRIPFAIVTGLTGYENMVITSLSIPRNAQNVNILRFTATLEQVRIVTAQTASALISNQATSDLASKTQDLGKQATTGASAKASSDASLLYQGAQWAGAL